MIYAGYIKGYPVVFERTCSLWDKEYLQETVEQLQLGLLDLPDTVSKEEFVKGMLKITRGTINPQIVIDVYEEIRG